MEVAAKSSFSLANAEDDFDEIVLPPPPKYRHHSRLMSPASSYSGSDRTPLVANSNRKKKGRMPCESSLMLFGQNESQIQHTSHYIDCQISTPSRSAASKRPGYAGIARFFFGFMYEDSDACVDLCHPSDTKKAFISIKLALCLSYMLTSASTTAAVTVIPAIGKSLVPRDNFIQSDVSAFTSRAASSAVLGLAIGKFVNGPLGDILGSRRLSTMYATLLAAALASLSVAWNESSALWGCFLIEFFQSVQWPGIIVILATHTSQGHGLEVGIYHTLLSAKFGSLLSIPLTTLLLRYYSWRLVSVMASLLALFGAGIFLLFVRDSPTQLDNPQNPIASSTRKQFSMALTGKPPMSVFIVTMASACFKIVREEIVPSLWGVMRRSIFWVVAIAHAGDAIVGSSQRVLGRYYYDTSGGTLSENTASSLAVAVLSVGTIAGLAIGGYMFTMSSSACCRKKLVARLYMMSIVSCYLLAVLAVPRLQRFIGGGELILAFELIATFFMGFGAAVQSYIPSIIGATFGKNKGLFSAYTDGVAYALSSIIWKIVAGAVFGGGTIGWAYGWAAVALLIVVCALLMVEFIENYFVQSVRQHRGNETIMSV